MYLEPATGPNDVVLGLRGLRLETMVDAVVTSASRHGRWRIMMEQGTGMRACVADYGVESKHIPQCTRKGRKCCFVLCMAPPYNTSIKLHPSRRPSIDAHVKEGGGTPTAAGFL